MAASVTTSVGVGSVTPATTVETASFTPTGANKVLFVLVGSGATAPNAPTAVKYASAAGVGGESLTLLDSVRIINTNVKTSVWRLIGPVAASGTLHATYGGTDDERWIDGVAVQDANGTTGTIAYATANGSTAVTTAAVTTSGGLILSFVSILSGSGGTPLLTSGQTSIKELEGATAGPNGIGINEAAGTESTVASGTSTAMTWTISIPADWGQHAFQVNAFSASGAVSLPDLLNPIGRRIAPLLNY